MQVTSLDIADALERGDEAVEEVYNRLPWQTNYAWSARLWDRGCNLYDARHDHDEEENELKDFTSALRDLVGSTVRVGFVTGLGGGLVGYLQWVGDDYVRLVVDDEKEYVIPFPAILWVKGAER